MIKPKINCPYCQHPVSRVIDVRGEPRTIRDQLCWDGEGLWRKRRCEGCRRDFTTSETLTDTQPAA